MQKTLVRQVRDANRRVFDSKDFDEYEENPSIFEASRQDEIERILHDTVANRDRILDVGCGTGNVLRLARQHFKECWGIDLSGNLLGELARREKDLRLIAGEADQLPFLENHFDMLSMYGVLHHRTTLFHLHSCLPIQPKLILPVTVHVAHKIVMVNTQ